jgi:hypothetical protein
MSKGPRTDVLALAALAAAAALGIGLLILGSPGGKTDPLAAIPADAFLVASIDVVALAESPLGEALVGELRADGGGARAGTLLGVDSITETCGFDPLPHLRSIAIALPERGEGEGGEGERGDFGVAAAGTMTKDALANCAKAVIAKRGGEPSSRQEGSFTVVSDARTHGGAEVAFRDGGPYLVGRGAWLTKMIDTADGRSPSTLSSSATEGHGALRAGLRTRDADAEAVRITALLPHDVRKRLQGQMERERSDGDSKGGAVNKAMEGVLGVSAAGIGLHAGRPHEDMRLAAELRCDSESACDAVSTFILHLRLGWSGNLSYRLVGLGPLIDNLEVQRKGTTLWVQTRGPVDDLAKVVERALRPALNPGPTGADRNAPIPTRPDKPTEPNETVLPRRDGGGGKRAADGGN